MALQITIENPLDGTNLTTAYARIGAASIDVAGERAAITVLIYKDSAARLNNFEPVISETYTWEAAGSPAITDYLGNVIPARMSFDEAFGVAAKNPVNVFARAYVVLKSSVTKYAAAIDV